MSLNARRDSALRAVTRLIAAATCLLLASVGSQAADIGEACCADLDARVAELEDTVARKLVRGVSLRISGHVNRMIQFWDDGEESNVYVSDNSAWSSRFRFNGVSHVTPDWLVGYRLEIADADGLSANLNQIDSNAFRGGWRVARSYLYVDQKQLGRLSLGFREEASNGATSGGDFSGLDVQPGAGLFDYVGGFFLRRKNVAGGAGLIPELTWGDVSIESPGDGHSERNVVRYDSPVVGGFNFAWSWGEDDDWTAAAFLTRDIGDFKLGASVGYSAYTSPISDCRLRSLDPSSKKCTAFGGGIGFLHVPTGLHAHYSAGLQHDDFHPFGILSDPNDQIFQYVKAGIYRQFLPLGHSGLFAEWYRGTKTLEQFFAAGTSSFTPGEALVRGSTVDFYGVTAFQDIEAVAAQLYLSYRNYGADLDVFDPLSLQRIPVPIDRFQSFLIGMKIDF